MLVEQYTELLTQSRGIILTDYRGLRVQEMEQMRRSVRDAKCDIHVVKNRLMKLALAEADLSVPDEWLNGPTAIAFCHSDMPPVAKTLSEFAEDALLSIKGGLLEAEILSSEQVDALAKLPSREVLLGNVLGTINAPATQMAGVVASGIRQVLNVLKAYADKLEEQGAPAPEAA
jgi:large subunit ribosomal protein L10